VIRAFGAHGQQEASHFYWGGTNVAGR